MVAVVFVIMWKVVPKLIGIFAEFGEMPRPTLILIVMSDFVQVYWYLFIFAPIVIVFALKAWRSTETGKYYSDLILLRAPALGSLVQTQWVQKNDKVKVEIEKIGKVEVKFLSLIHI